MNFKLILVHHSLHLPQIQTVQYFSKNLIEIYSSFSDILYLH